MVLRGSEVDYSSFRHQSRRHAFAVHLDLLKVIRLPSSVRIHCILVKHLRDFPQLTNCLSLQDFVAYLVSSGLLDLLTSRLSSPSLIAELHDGSIDKSPGNLALLSIQLLTSLVRLIPPCKNLATGQTCREGDDPTFFFDAVAATEAFGLISLLYGITLLVPNSATNTGALTPLENAFDFFIDKNDRPGFESQPVRPRGCTPRTPPETVPLGRLEV